MNKNNKITKVVEIRDKILKCSQSSEIESAIKEWRILFNDKSDGACVCYNMTTMRILYLGISGCKKIGIHSIDPANKNSLLIEYLRTPVGKEAIDAEYLDLNMEIGFHNFLNSKVSYSMQVLNSKVSYSMQVLNSKVSYSMQVLNSKVSYSMQVLNSKLDEDEEFYDVIHPMELFHAHIRDLIENFGFYSGVKYFGVNDEKSNEKNLSCQKEIVEISSDVKEEKVKKHNRTLRYREKISEMDVDNIIECSPTGICDTDSYVDVDNIIESSPTGICDADSCVDVDNIIESSPTWNCDADSASDVDNIIESSPTGICDADSAVDSDADYVIEDPAPIYPEIRGMNITDLRERINSTLYFLSEERRKNMAELNLAMYKNKVDAESLRKRMNKLKIGIEEYKKDFSIFRKNLDNYIQKVNSIKK